MTDPSGCHALVSLSPFNLYLSSPIRNILLPPRDFQYLPPPNIIWKRIFFLCGSNPLFFCLHIKVSCTKPFEKKKRIKMGSRNRKSPFLREQKSLLVLVIGYHGAIELEFKNYRINRIKSIHFLFNVKKIKKALIFPVRPSFSAAFI